MLRSAPHVQVAFQYMLLLRGATEIFQRFFVFHDVSIHAPLARSNLLRPRPRPPTPPGFNTCSSCEEQHSSVADILMDYYVSIHAPLARSNLVHSAFQTWDAVVSIHAPLARSNSDGTPTATTGLTVSIHAPLARSNALAIAITIRAACFNTCSSCEEQLFRTVPAFIMRCFNTCSSCEEQRQYTCRLPCRFRVSIHAPLARSNKSLHPISVRKLFQYMLLLRGATISLSVFVPVILFQYMLLLRGATQAHQTAPGCFPFQYMLLLRGATFHIVSAG